jgi:chlorophyllase
MRRFVCGIVVAFMKAYLLGDNSDLMAIRDGHETAPVELKTIDVTTHFFFFFFFFFIQT